MKESKNIINESTGKTIENALVAYFSHSGNTRKIAQQIQELVEGDIFKIEPINDYPERYNDVLQRGKQELKAGTEPVLKEKVNSMSAYHVIFIGYPNWWNTFPAPVKSFLKNYDFSGKLLVPFCTHGGGGAGRSFDEIRELCPGANVLEGFSINGYRVDDHNAEVIQWISDIKNAIYA